MKIDLVQAFQRLDPGLYGATVCRELGINANLAYARQDFDLPGIGKARISQPDLGRGGTSRGGAVSLTWNDWIDLYAKRNGLTYGQACAALRQLGEPLLVPSIPSGYRASLSQTSNSSARVDVDEATHKRLTDIKPLLHDGMSGKYWCHYGNKPITNDALVAHGGFDANFWQYPKDRYSQRVTGIPAFTVEPLTKGKATPQPANFQIWPGYLLKAIDFRNVNNNFANEPKKCLIAECGQREDLVITSTESVARLQSDRQFPGLIGLRVEGPKDVLVGWVLSQSANCPVVCFSNLFGADTHRIDEPIMQRLKELGCETMLIVGDQDEAGARSALVWSESARKFFPSVRNLQLPFELVRSHGKDLRDWAAESPRTWQDLISLPSVVQGAK